MVKRPNPNDRLLAKALKNGAVIEGEVPKKLKPRAPKPHHTGEFIHRLTGPNGCASRGWEWIETEDAVNYRWCTANGERSPWGSYDEITKIAFGPGRAAAR
jgi:hypothetical protein